MQPYFKQLQSCRLVAFKLLINGMHMCVRCRYADFKRNVAFKFTAKQQFNFFFSSVLSLWDSVAAVQSNDLKKAANPEDDSGILSIDF